MHAAVTLSVCCVGGGNGWGVSCWGAAVDSVQAFEVVVPNAEVGRKGHGKLSGEAEKWAGVRFT